MTNETEPQPRPELRGQVAPFRYLDRPVPAPELRFRTLSGTTVDLRDFRGKVVLLHFWATWCILCVYELPALDRLIARRHDDPFVVIAISVDWDGDNVVAPFFARNNISHLSIYLDQTGATLAALSASDLPSSYLIDHNGSVVGHIAGMANWDSLEAKQFLDYFTSQVPR